MVNNYAELVLIFLVSLILSCHGFWWRSSTEATPAVKQIPVGYFRTYTYHQPMAYPGSFYNSPFGGSLPPHQQSSSLSNRFASWSQFPSSSNNAPILSNFKYDALSVPSTTVSSSTPTSTMAPTTTTTTTQQTTQPPTTTSTTPPPPPPQYQQAPQQINTNLISTAIGHTFVESHHQPPPPLPPSSPSQNIQHISSGPMRSSNYHPTATTHNDFTKYPYYYLNNMQQQQQQPKPMQQVRFVPCMCPITVTISSEYPENRSASLEDDMGLPDSENLQDDELKFNENRDDASIVID